METPRAIRGMSLRAKLVAIFIALPVILYGQFDRNIKLEVETVHSLIQEIYAQQQKGLLTEADARKKAADLVRTLRFDNGNYFWNGYSRMFYYYSFGDAI